MTHQPLLNVALTGLLSAVALTACGGSDDPVVAAPVAVVAAAVFPPVPTLIAHRGASALRPEHTIASYTQAIEDGADIIEPDLVATKDGVLVARHENAIAILNADGSLRESTTDIATRPEFAALKATKTIDGTAITGWFTEDLTLAQLKTLRAVERIPAIRPGNVPFNGEFQVPTLQEVIDLAKSKALEKGRTIGVYPETKHPTYFKSIGLPLERRLLDVLSANGWNSREAPVFIQSFEVGNLKEMRALTTTRIVQLLSSSGRPYDFVAAGPTETRSYADLITPAGLREVATYANGIGPSKDMVIPLVNGNLGTPTALVANAKAANLFTHIYTLRPENNFLPTNLKKAPVTDNTVRGDSVTEIQTFLQAGIDGFFTDDSAVGRTAIRTFVKR
ncbi:MAG: glycerophosphodiester phosphodiesterase [Polaromonas sp.]